MNPHFLTVAGAAPELTVEVSPASRFTRHGKPCAGTTNGANYSKRVSAFRKTLSRCGHGLPDTGANLIEVESTWENLMRVKEIDR
jgi:hypothetical protein